MGRWERELRMLRKWWAVRWLTGTDDEVLEGNSGKQVRDWPRTGVGGIGELNQDERERKMDRKGTRQ